LAPEPETAASIDLDEGIAESLAERLDDIGHGTLSTRQAGNKGQTDPQQLAFAREAGRILVTCNGRDLAALHETLVIWAAFWDVPCESTHPGILIVPNGNEIGVEELAVAIADMLGRHSDLGSHCFAYRRRDGWHEVVPARMPRNEAGPIEGLG
jgi:hypothetical protein